MVVDSPVPPEIAVVELVVVLVVVLLVVLLIVLVVEPTPVPPLLGPACATPDAG